MIVESGRKKLKDQNEMEVGTNVALTERMDGFPGTESDY